MGTAPTMTRTPRAKRALGALIGVQTPTYAITLSRLTWKQRLTRWAARKAWRMVRRSARRMFVTWRRAMAPWFIAAAVWVATAIMSLADRGYFTIAALAGLGGVALYQRLGFPLGRLSRRRNLKPMAQRAWYAAFYLALSAWAITGAAWTVLPPMAGILLAITMVSWVAWMWHHRSRPAEAVAGDVLAFDERGKRWEKVSGQGKALPGAELENIAEHQEPKRWEADINLPSGDLTVENVFSAHRRICSAFSARRDNVILDEAKGGAEDRAKLTVVLENPCHGVIEYNESWQTEYAEGCFPFHTYPDGFRGGLRLWQPMSGTAHALFSGDTRSGKSAGMEAGAIQTMMTGMVWPLIGDPQGGQSMPALCGPEGHAKSKATDPEAVLNQLLAIREAMYVRSRLLQRMKWRDEDGTHVGIGFYDPQVTGLPILLYILDEAHVACNDPEYGEQIVALIDEIVKMAGKTGIAVWLATQYPGIEELGGKMSVRQQLVAGNVVSYRNSASVSKGMVLPSHMPSPYDIPKETPEGGHTKGTAVVYSAAPRSSRATYSRSVWVRRAHYWAGVAAQRIPDLAKVDPYTAEALARYLPSAHLLAEPAAAAAVEPTREQVVVSEPKRETPAPAVEPGKRQTVMDRIEAYLRQRETGWATTGVIREAVGAPLSTVSTTLSRAEKAGRAHQHQGRPGYWALGPAPKVQPAHEQLAIDDEEAA